MPNKPRKSTTPKSDEVATLYRNLYAYHSHRDVSSRAVFYAERCEKCGGKLQFLMSGYAMHQGPMDNAMVCGSGHVQWIHIRLGVE